jgi:dimethylargininase
MTLHYALVREPGSHYARCISSHPLHHTVNVTRARHQHALYTNTLAELGLEVIRLSPHDDHPDACFVEDTAVIHNSKALIARLAISSRQGEEESVAAVLQEYFPLKHVMAPGTLEGGDVIHVPDCLISGISQRTNQNGVEQMKAYFGVTIKTINDPQLIHLKSHVTYLNNNVVLATRTYANHPALSNFDVLTIGNNEGYAANTLTINDTVIMPTQYPKTQKIIEEAGFDVISLNVSEFAKCDGALTCLSLLF